LDCNQAPMCDCQMCNPVACIVHTEDGKSCKWPDSAEWCKSWIEEQCSVPVHRPGGGLGGLMGGGRLPLPGMLKPVPSKEPKEPEPRTDVDVVKKPPANEIIKKVDCNHAPMCDCSNCNPEACIVHTDDGSSCMWPPSQDFCVSWKEDQCGSPQVGPGRRPGGGLGDLISGGRLPLPGLGTLKPVKTTSEPVATTAKPPTKETIRIVSCNHAPMCDCSTCNPEACIVHTEDGDACMWPPSQNFCVQWKEDQCGGGRPIGRPGGGLGDILRGGGFPFPGKGGLKPVKTTAGPTQRPIRLPGMGDITGVSLKPVERHTTSTTQEPSGPQDKPMCKSFNLAKGCSNIHKRMCPASCAKFA